MYEFEEGAFSASPDTRAFDRNGSKIQTRSPGGYRHVYSSTNLGVACLCRIGGGHFRLYKGLNEAKHGGCPVLVFGVKPLLVLVVLLWGVGDYFEISVRKGQQYDAFALKSSPVKLT